MLRGRFGDTTGRPYIEGRIIIPRLNNLTHDISFLVDTGADRTLLCPVDGVAMGLDYNQLRDPQESVGFGGNAKTFREPAVILFAEHDRLRGYIIELKIAEPNSEIMDLPSVVGRDVIDRWRINYNPRKGRLYFHVWDSDLNLKPRR